MSNRELPMMPWFPERFAITVQTWKFAERAAYRALLDVQWSLAVLPAEAERLAQAIGMPLDQFRKAWPVVSTKFARVTGGLQNKNLEEERAKAFRLKEGRKAGANSTNAARSAQRGAERGAKHDAQRTSESESGSGSSSETPFPPQSGGIPAVNGRGRRDRGARAASRSAWELALQTARSGGASSGDETVDQAARQMGGYNSIGSAHVARRSENRSRFRELYEQILERRS